MKDALATEIIFFQSKCIMFQFIISTVCCSIFGSVKARPKHQRLQVCRRQHDRLVVCRNVCFGCWLVLGSTAASDSNECIGEIEALWSFVSMIYQGGMRKALLDSWAWKGTSETPEPSEFAAVELVATIVFFGLWFVLDSTAASGSSECTTMF